jgi:molybdopterin-containing oxidoreductase family iron-sulfur binding subunit
MNEDTVTNGEETVRFSQLMKDKGGERLNEILGTEPSVYYLPPVNRLFPFKDPVKTEEAKKEK